MGRIDNLKANEVQALVRTVRRVSTTAPLGSTSVHNGQTRFVGANSLKVEGTDGLLVTGSSSTTGTANVSGTQNVSGAQVVSGSSTITGTQSVSGTQTVTGAQNVSGPFGLSGTQTVSGGGKIVVGPITISPTGTYGARISCSTVLEFSTPSLAVLGNLLASGALGANTLSMLTPGTTTNPANVFVAPDGTLQKVTSAAKYKYDPQTMDLPASLLDVPVRDWLDSGAVDRFVETVDAPRPYTKEHQATIDDTQSLKRVPGVIAQEVTAAGGEAFVSRSPDGEIEGVAYDRFALARTAVLAQKLEQAMALIEDLQKQVTSLSAKPATP